MAVESTAENAATGLAGTTATETDDTQSAKQGSASHFRLARPTPVANTITTVPAAAVKSTQQVQTAAAVETEVSLGPRKI